MHLFVARHNCIKKCNKYVFWIILDHFGLQQFGDLHLKPSRFGLLSIGRTFAELKRFGRNSDDPSLWSKSGSRSGCQAADLDPRTAEDRRNRWRPLKITKKAKQVQSMHVPCRAMRRTQSDGLGRYADRPGCAGLRPPVRPRTRGPTLSPKSESVQREGEWLVWNSIKVAVRFG